MELDVYLAAIAAGDTTAFARWLAAAEPRVRDSLRTFARVVDVEAVLQETLLRTWQVAPRVVADGAGNSLLRLAIRIGRNLAISDVRRLRAQPVEPDALDAAQAAQAVRVGEPDPMLREAIHDCRDKLPAKPRLALDARIAAAGASDDGECADTLGMRLNTFLQNVTRARQLLADCLRKRGIVIDQELA